MKMSVISTTMPETNATELSQTFILTKKNFFLTLQLFILPSLVSLRLKVLFYKIYKFMFYVDTAIEYSL